MNRVIRLCVLLALLGVAGAGLSAQQLTPAWVQLGEGSTVLVKVVVASSGACPAIDIDGSKEPMIERQPTPRGFLPLCEAALPPKTRVASVNGQPLVLPRFNPSRVVAIGDTGCRIKGARAQNCNDPKVWPFQTLASGVANEKPELIIHVGDYLYRESPCPDGAEAMCGGTPVGDNWEAWNSDFFSPAAKLLAAAPWVFSRGNHEDCDRSWRGWFYYLDPRRWSGVCAEYTSPYLIKLGTFELAVLDSSATKEDDWDETQVATYAGQLASMHATNAWLISHYPFWGFKTNPHGGPPVSLVAGLQAAWEKSAPAGFSLILSGHVHLFEYNSVDHGRPPQLIAGDGGTEMAVPIQISVKGT